MAGGLIDLYGGKGSASSKPSGSAPVDLYAGSAKAPKPHGGGGVLGGIGGFFSHLGSDAASAISGLPTGAEKLGTDFYKTVTSHAAWHSGGSSKAAENLPLSKDLSGMAHQYGQTYGPLVHGHLGQFGHDLYQHPLGPILDAATIATLGAGGVAKAGELASRAGMISDTSRLATLGKAADLTAPGIGTDERILLRQSSRNPLVRWRQQLVNKGLNALPSETPVIGSTARAVRAIQRGPMREGARLDIQARDFNQAWSKLSKPEQAAFHLHMRSLTPQAFEALGLPPDAYRSLVASQDANAPILKVLDSPKVQEAVANPSPALAKALTLGRELSDRLTASRVAAGHLDEQTALESPFRHLRLVSGAKFEPVTEESPALVAAKAERDKLAAQLDKAQTSEAGWLGQAKGRNLGRLSPEAAQVRLAALDKQYEALLGNVIPHVSPYGGDLSRAEQLRRNYIVGKTGRLPLTVKQEERDLADAAIRDAMEKRPHEPSVQLVAKMMNERDALKAALQSHAEAPIFDTEPLPFPEGTAEQHGLPLGSNPHRDRLVTLGHRLEAAQAAVDHLAGRTAQTGDVQLVGGLTPEEIMRRLDAAGIEQPTHILDSARAHGIRSRFSSKPSGFAAPAQGVKGSRLVLASKGLINPHENALGRDFATYRDQAAAQLLHDELVKHAALIPHGEVIPHGWTELKLNRGQASAPYTVRSAGALGHELTDRSLMDRLRASGHLSELPGTPEGAGRLVVPHQVQRLLEDESKSYLSRAAAIRRVPLNAWKALVLGLRPAFFGNITIGNSILGMLQMAPGRWGFASWLNQVLPGFEHTLGPKLTEETMRSVLPEQVTGTFGESLRSHTLATTKAGRVAHKLSAGVMPATISWENLLRRAMAEGWARSTPEVQKILERNGGDVNAALREVAKSHPQIIDGISRRVDNALGNYRTYNRFERSIKNVVPFYGWNRHVTMSLARLASERPQVLDALLQVGDTGKARADRIVGSLPAYLNESIPVHLPGVLGGETGAGIQTVLDPRSWNPLSTITDEGRIVASPFTHAGAAGDAFPLAPDLQAAIEQLTGESMLTGAPIKGNAFADELRNLVPQESIFTRKRKATSVNQNSRYAQLLRLLGLPVENVNVPAATQQWRTINVPVKPQGSSSSGLVDLYGGG